MLRREFLIATGAMLASTHARDLTRLMTTAPDGDMYGLIGKMTAIPGQRAALAEILLEGTAMMPGCLSYIIAADSADADALWITEVWDSTESHRAALELPEVRAAIARGRPLIAGFDSRVETVPFGGYGLYRDNGS